MSAPTTMTGVGHERAIDRRREQTRAEILEAAWELCRSAGLAGLSLRELAARVGMRAPSLYSYFASKEAIYDAMFAAGQRQLLEAFGDLATDATDRETFRQAAHRFFDFCTADPVRYQLMFQRTIPGFEPSEGSYALAIEVVRKLQAALRTSEMAADRHVDLWTAIMTGLTDQQISNDLDGDRWRRLLDEAVDMFCDHVGIPPAPADPSTGETP